MKRYKRFWKGGCPSSRGNNLEKSSGAKDFQAVFGEPIFNLLGSWEDLTRCGVAVGRNFGQDRTV